MRPFLLKVSLFSLLLLLSAYLIFCTADGYTDAYYKKFTVPKPHSLILGNSKAAQGVISSIIQDKVGCSDMLNFSFSLSHSPYGEAYLGAIKQVLDTTHTDHPNLFILSVDPWNISLSGSDNLLSHQFREAEVPPATVNQYQTNPNIPYLLNNYTNPFYKLLFTDKSQKASLLHNDGWYEVNVEMDSTQIAIRTKDKLLEYSESKSKHYQLSAYRIHSLRQTIGFLKRYGTVVLVQLPVSKPMWDLEQQYARNFNQMVQAIASSHHIRYINLMPLHDHFVYTDGNHLWKESAKMVSQIICDSLMLPGMETAPSTK